MTKRVFDIERFKYDENISFYTGFPKYDTFVATFEFLNPGVEGDNWTSVTSHLLNEVYQMRSTIRCKKTT